MRGEVTFDALGKRWSLFLGTAAQCGLEEEYDRGYLAILLDAMPNIDPDDLEDRAKVVRAAMMIRKTVLRSIAFWGLRKGHPGIDMETVNDILDELGDARFGEVIGKAIAAAVDRAKPDAGEAAARPGKPATPKRARTGTR